MRLAGIPLRELHDRAYRVQERAAQDELARRWERQIRGRSCQRCRNRNDCFWEGFKKVYADFLKDPSRIEVRTDEEYWAWHRKAADWRCQTICRAKMRHAAKKRAVLEDAAEELVPSPGPPLLLEDILVILLRSQPAPAPPGTSNQAERIAAWVIRPPTDHVEAAEQEVLSTLELLTEQSDHHYSTDELDWRLLPSLRAMIGAAYERLALLHDSDACGKAPRQTAEWLLALLEPLLLGPVDATIRAAAATACEVVLATVARQLQPTYKAPLPTAKARLHALFGLCPSSSPDDPGQPILDRMSSAQGES